MSRQDSLVRTDEGSEKDQKLLRQTQKRHTSHYLRRLEEDLGLTPEKLVEIQVAAREYETNLPSVAKWMREGYELERVFELLEARSRVDALIEERLSFPTMTKLQEQFCTIPTDPEQFAETVKKIKRNTECNWDYLSSILNEMVEIGRSRDVRHHRRVMREFNSLHA